MKKKYVASSTFDGYRKLVTLRADSTNIRTIIPQASGHRFHGYPDTFRQAETQDYSLP